MAERFKCSKCAHKEAKIKRIAATGTGLSKLIDLQHNHFLVVSCANCGFSELYDERILGCRSGASDLLDLLFGH
ncbi:MAG: zinc ribbon domain-containing protein [Planctomycetes bacterium]|nr:zinc ribbon domain-containing protein [Planctomycetota bacterium]